MIYDKDMLGRGTSFGHLRIGTAESLWTALAASINVRICFDCFMVWCKKSETGKKGFSYTLP